MNVRLGGVDRAQASRHHGAAWCAIGADEPGAVYCRTTDAVLFDGRA